MKKIIKKITPEFVFRIYHYSFAVLANLFYGFPSRKMIVIGVTGTKGKTTTSNFIWSALQSSNIKTGLLSTANLKIGDEEILNPFHMTMPGRFTVQKYLRKMQKNGCKVVIVEVTSQGLIQYRHIGINFDFAVFTNLTPEHIDAHKTFENYKKAKGILFKYLTHFRKKVFDNKEIPKTIIVNKDDPNYEYYYSFDADKKITFSRDSDSDFKATNILQEKDNVRFNVAGSMFELSVLGEFNVINALPAILIARNLGVNDESIAKGLKSLSLIPGRMEIIDIGQNFKVVVDYAHEKQSMTLAMNTARNVAKNNKVIVLLGAEGGGRDKGKRPEMGEIVGKFADYVICSNVDPYEDDPLPIAEDIAVASERVGKIRNENLFVILDRREGIKKALSLAGAGDVVMITGKGAEQSMIIGGKTIPWDDRLVVTEELKKLIV